MYNIKKRIKKIRDMIPVNIPADAIPVTMVVKSIDVLPPIATSSLSVSSVTTSASSLYNVGKHIATTIARKKFVSIKKGSASASPSVQPTYISKPFFRNLSTITDIPKAKKISYTALNQFVPVADDI
jgi:hypothetical protein